MKKIMAESQMPPKVQKHRNYIGTDNNLDSKLATDAGRREVGDKVKFLCCQIERGEEEKRDHVQFVVCCKTQLVLGSYDAATKRGVGIKGLLGSNTIHVEPVQDLKGAIKYCQKEETRIEGPFIFGEAPHQGKRTDLADACMAVQRGANMRQLCAEFPSVVAKYPHGMATLIANQPRGPRGEPIIIWIWGASGSGKSKWIEENIRSKYEYGEYDDVEGTTWFPDYHGEAICIFDDFNANLSFGYYNKICDRYPLSVPVKGGSVGFVASTIIFASVDSPVDETSRIRQKYDWRGEHSRRMNEYAYIAHVENKDGVLWDIERKQPMASFVDIVKVKDPELIPVAPEPESPGFDLMPEDEPSDEEKQGAPSDIEAEDQEPFLFADEDEDGYFSRDDGDYSISL